MYGTIARLQLKPGMDERLRELTREHVAQISGLVSTLIYRTDAAANEYYLAVTFESQAAYQANAASPEQHTRYEQYRELLAAEPEWHDGEIVFSSPA